MLGNYTVSPSMYNRVLQFLLLKTGKTLDYQLII